MKKKTLIAAAAALLLSGGVFVMTNQANSSLAQSNVDALSQLEIYPGYEYGETHTWDDGSACCRLGDGNCSAGRPCPFTEED